MTKKYNLAALVTLSLSLAGCASNDPVEVVEQPPQVKSEAVQALSQLVELKEEMKLLRNAIEEMQFNAENDRRQQQRALAQLEQRISDLGQGAQLVQQNTVAVTADPIVIDQQNQIQVPEANTQIVVPETTVDTTSSQNANSIEAVGGVVASNSSVVTLNEQQSYDRAFDLLKQSRYEDAITGFQTLADTWPEGGLADDAYYWISEARYVNREFEAALSGFRVVVSRYPDSQRVPEALLKIGYIQYDIGSYEDAAETFRDILEQFPGHQVSISAKTRLRRIEDTIQ